MEKKQKKLQLRKETITVLTGNEMTNIAGGNGIQCAGNIDCPDGYVCLDTPDGFFCQPEDSGFRLTVKNTCRDTCGTPPTQKQTCFPIAYQYSDIPHC